MATKKVDLSPITSSATMPEFKKSFHFNFEGTGNDDILAAAILRFHYAFQSATMAHNAKGVGLGAAFLPFTDADVLNWCTSGHADEVPELVERVDDVSAILVQMRLKGDDPDGQCFSR